MQIGLRALNSALELIAKCTETKHWPAYSESAEVIDLPSWAYKQTEALKQ
jgi:hypothetical protein